METRDLVENSSAQLTKKNLDMVVANNLKVEMCIRDRPCPAHRRRAG